MTVKTVTLIRLPATPREVAAGKPIWMGAIVKINRPRKDRRRP